MLSRFAAKLASLMGEQTDFGIASPSKRSEHAFLHTHSLGEILPYLSYDPQFELFHNPKSVGFVFESLPLVGSSEMLERQLSGLFQHTLPEGSNIQILLIASSRIEDQLKAWQRPRDQAGGVLEALGRGRCNFFKEAIHSGAPLVRAFRIIVSYSQSGVDLDSYEVEKLSLLKQQMITTFMGLGMPVKVWDATDLIRGLDEILNLDARLDFPELVWNPHQDIASQLMSPTTNLMVDSEGLLQAGGDYTLRSYRVRSYPPQWHLQGMNNLIGDPFNDLMQIPCSFLIHYGIHICNEKTLKTRVLQKCSQVEKQAYSPIAKWVPSLKQEAEEWGFVRQQFEEGQRLVRTCYQVMLMAPTAQISSAQQQLLNLYRANRWELQLDKFLQLPSLISCLPMTWGDGMAEQNKMLQKTKMTLSHEPPNLLPLQGEWYGTQSPGMLLTGRRGQLFYWNPFDNDAGNYNTCVVGRSGSGKSVFMQELMTSVLGLGGRVFVLDVGRSFEKTAKLLEGQFIEFSTHSPICINPFTTIPTDNSEATSDALAMLKPVVALMAAPTEGTDDLENAYIEKALHEAWEHKGREASMSEVAKFLTAQKDKKAQELGHKLYPYTAKGTYGRFFTGASNIDLGAKLVVVELEELKERKDLQAVVVQMVILQITNLMFLGDRKTPFLMVLDEAWDMLRGKQSGVFIETLARRLRKYFGSLVVGTQSINDFYASPGAQAAFDNSDWMCLLSQKKESIDQLKESKRLSVDAHMEQMLRSVTTKQGQYAEVMVAGANGYAIGRLLLDPFSQVLYSTKPEEFSAVQAYQQQGLSLESAIEHVVRNKEAVLRGLKGHAA